MLLYKLPRFYNAYATSGAIMICFILEASVFIPKGVGHSRTFELEGINICNIDTCYIFVHFCTYHTNIQKHTHIIYICFNYIYTIHIPLHEFMYPSILLQGSSFPWTSAASVHSTARRWVLHPVDARPAAGSPPCAARCRWAHEALKAWNRTWDPQLRGWLSGDWMVTSLSKNIKGKSIPSWWSCMVISWYNDMSFTDLPNVGTYPLVIWPFAIEHGQVWLNYQRVTIK
jgi:hypothetical protein